jgi:hypothetical protein
MESDRIIFCAEMVIDESLHAVRCREFMCLRLTKVSTQGRMALKSAHRLRNS